MIVKDEPPRDLARLVVPLTGSLVASDDPWEPYWLHDQGGTVLAPVSAHLRDLQACGRAATTQRSYAMDLLRWFRFLWAIEVPWNQATGSKPGTSASGSSSLTSLPDRTGGIPTGH